MLPSCLQVYFIGVKCDLEILEQRERLRGNRVINSARSQHKKVHNFCKYDLIVDTSKKTPRECAEKIKNFIFQNEPWAFKQLVNEV